MMFVKCLLVSAVAAVAAAQDWATYTEPADAVKAGFANPPAGDFTDAAKVKREDYGLIVDRNSPSQADPYDCWNCGRWYDYSAVPSDPKCNANNCYRAFLNGRDGSDEKHCPSTAMFDCCYWYTLCDNDKYWFVAHGWVAKYAPWTEQCGASSYTCDADVKTVVGKINDVCACTIRHTIKVDTTSPYYALRKEWPFSSKCH